MSSQGTEELGLLWEYKVARKNLATWTMFTVTLLIFWLSFPSPVWDTNIAWGFYAVWIFLGSFTVWDFTRWRRAWMKRRVLT